MDKQKLKKFSPFIIGGVLSIGLLIGGFGVMSGAFTRAADTDPREVAVSNITESSATITWSTGIESQGLVTYGTTVTAMSLPAPETNKTKTHSVSLSLLASNTTYYFQITIGGKTYTNGGIPWTFNTKGTMQSNLTPTPTLVPTPGSQVIQRLTVGTVTPTPNPICKSTDCIAVKANIGKGCVTHDYWYCVQRTTPSNQ